MRESVEDAARRSSASDRIIFLGNLSDVRPLLAASDLSALASTAVETFSIAMLESMAMEVPPIVTDIGGVREAVIPGETGYIVPAGDSASLMHALAKGLRIDYQDRSFLKLMGKSSRMRARELFSKEEMIRDTQEILDKVVL